MELLYVSSVPSPKEFERIKTQIRDGVNVTTYGMDESGFKFHTLILNGLCANEDVHIDSLVGRNIGHHTHTGIWWKGRTEKVNEKLTYHHIACINLPVVKQFFMGLSFFFGTLGWMIKNRGKERGIVMDAAYVTVLPFVLAAKRFFKCKTTAIFCDLYDYMAEVKDANDAEKVSLTRRTMRKISKKSYQKLDSYVFLTEAMDPVINLQKKSYIVMEGLVDSNMETVENTLEKKAPGKVVMYAGALREAYGLKNLIEGFSAYQDPDAVLWIYGDGDYVDEIQAAAERESRICYRGKAPQSEVVEKEQEATLLINPRPADKEFTKYSFPSKNMEYMVSGTPIMTTRLPGMPEEYYDYVYTIDGDKAADITEALAKALAKTPAELFQRGEAAKQFVLKKKNNRIQANRILSLLRG
jgi:glycosyltransferase involved in cell wall biosynthesis